MASNRLILPLTLCRSTPQQSAALPNTPDILESSCSRATPTSLVSWATGSNDAESMERSGHSNLDLSGAAMGCADGTVYVFHAGASHHHHAKSSSDSSPTHINSSGLLRPSSPVLRSKITRSKSRSSSPSSVRSGLAPFTVSSRSRIVSGLSYEQAEAPKNYVDFEEEPEKLKDMLKGKGPKERSSVPESIRSPSPSSSHLLSSPAATVAQRADNSSAISSPPSTSRSISRVPSPTFSALATPPSPASAPLLLKFHICPVRFGFGHGVSSMEIIHQNQELLCLQESGYLSIFSLRDGTCTFSSLIEDDQPLSPPDGIRSHDMSYHIWSWKKMQTLTYEEKVFVLVCATDPSSASSMPLVPGDHQDDVSEVTRIAIFELKHPSAARWDESPLLEKLGEWCVDGPVHGVGLSDTLIDDSMVFFYVTHVNHLVIRKLSLFPTSLKATYPSLADSDKSHDNSLASLPLPNPFKSLKMRSTERVSMVEPEKRLGRIILGDETDVGEITAQVGGNWIVAGIRIMNSAVIVWSDTALIVCGIDMKGWCLSPVGTALSISSITDVKLITLDSYLVISNNRAELYTSRHVEEVGEDARDSSSIHRLDLSRTISLPNHSAVHILPHTGVLLTTRDDKGRRSLELLGAIAGADVGMPRAVPESKGSPGKAHSTTLWKANRRTKDSDLFFTALLPLDLNVIIAGYSDGFIRHSSLANLAADWSGASTKTSDISLNALITSLFVVNNRRTFGQMIIGGGDDGSIACWDAKSLALTAKWILFITPLQDVIEMPESGSLKDCVLCLAYDGTIAVIAVDGCQFLYIIPGATSPLEHIYFDSNNILLVYSHGWARLWDLSSQEFRRSLTWDKAADMVAQGQEWMETQTNDRKTRFKPGSVAGAVAQTFCNADTAASLLIDLEAIVNHIMSSFQSSRDTQRQYRAILSALLTFGLSADIDRICQEGLCVQDCSVSVGFMSCDSLVNLIFDDPRAPWTVSSEVSAARALAIIALLRALMAFEDLADSANTIIAFYASTLEGVVGPAYQAPSQTYLANAWLNASSDLRASIYILFEAGLAYLSDEEANRLVDTWEPLLPILLPDNMKETHTAAMALFLCGYVAVSKYNLLSTGTLAAISKSIAHYLHDETSMYRALAIDLCSRGFTVWQQYVDAMDMLRALFLLATTIRKDTISTQNPAPLARAAVLRIASSNSPLFMTTLAFDILNPKNMEHRRSVMQLVAFFIRKQPLVLYPNLPRLVEAVVKSLDPNSTANREAVLDTATEILGHVVKTFPTVDFHMATQRLAVGTSEGAVIMYDLKTATRLYVLEGHKKRMVACSFSPDGRRLVTVSLEESVVLVWKVGSSFSSFFNPGAPPRQGHGGSEPYKHLSFNVGDEAKMTIAGTLEFIHFEWPTDRSVKLKIRESTLTFST